MPNLKPCPFCGGKAVIRYGSGYYFMWSVVAECEDCHARTVPALYGNNGTLKAEDCSYDGRENAVALVTKRWNQRATAPEKEDTHEQDKD